MKVRLGFVSNSSSSSFCIYGTFLEYNQIETEECIQFILENGEDFKGKTPQDVKDDIDENGIDEIFYALESKMNLVYYMIDGDDGVFIGDSWSSVGDDQTGRQFKDEVEAKIKKLWPNAKFDTHEEAWRDG